MQVEYLRKRLQQKFFISIWAFILLMNDRQATDRICCEKWRNQVNTSGNGLQIGGKNSLSKPDEKSNIDKNINSW
jgi:hypothetical protein